MLSNYFKIALRILIRNKASTLINTLGLALGIACCLLLSLYIQDELQYDAHHQNLDRVFRIKTKVNMANGVEEMNTTSPPTAAAAQAEIAEIESITRLLNPPGVSLNLLRYKENMFYETNGFVADSSLFDVLSYEFTEGNATAALTMPNAVVLKESLANKLFGEESALHKIINISQGGESNDYMVTGVVKDSKSFIDANFFTSTASTSGIAFYLRMPQAMDEWGGQNFVPVYLKLKENTQVALVEEKLNQLVSKYGAEDMKALGVSKTLSLEPVKDIYLYSSNNKNARIVYLYIIGSIAAFILLIACINFMNLATAKAARRASEVGIRKVMGALRSNLVFQFVGEAVLIVLLAVFLSLVFVQLGMPLFNQLTGKTLHFSFHNAPYFFGALGLITVVTGLLAGSYPALYLSGFRPVQVLKGKFALGGTNSYARKTLVVLQFTISIALVCAMIIVGKQLDYMREKDLGFSANDKIVMPLRTQNARNAYDVMKKEIAADASVVGISGTEYVPGGMIWNDMGFYADGSSMDQSILHRINNIDQGYLSLMNIKLLAGRDFNDNRLAESEGKIIANKTSVKKFGYEPADAIGKRLHFEWQSEKYDFEIIGVMEDFHQTSVKDAIVPIVFKMVPQTTELSYMVIDFKKGSDKNVVALLESKWKALVADTPFEYQFLDEAIKKQYIEEQKMAGVITSFTLIAMFISCLGLYGLSSFMAQRRVKEIGIRKVLGANIRQITQMMSIEFMKLLLIAFAIAAPLAWYVMQAWINNFAYQVEIKWYYFLLAGMVAMLVAMITVSMESIRAATANPADALHDD